MKGPRLILLALAALALNASVLAAKTSGALLLVQGAQARATIVLGENPSVSAQLAAHELQHYVQKISGATLPIVEEPAEAQGAAVLVGASKATESLGLKNEDFEHTEYLIETRGDKLILMGRDTPKADPIDYQGNLAEFVRLRYEPLGSCYAVHTFLEKFLDVRWYLPSELGEVVRKRKTIRVPGISIRRMPQASEFASLPHGVNKRLYMPDYEKAKEELEYNRDFDLRAGVVYFIRNKRWGCRPFGANHSFHGWDKAFGEEHPEWFSTKSWKKMQEIISQRGGYQKKIQQVLSNEGLVKKKIEVIKAYFAGQPAPFPGAYYSARGNSFGICLNDNSSWSQDPKCVEQYEMRLRYDARLSRYFWDFVNRVSSEVGKTHPNGQIVGLAYSWWRRPPKGHFRLEPNVSVQICRAPILFWKREFAKEDRRDVETWLRYGARHIYSWEYLLRPSVNTTEFPAVLPRTYAYDAKWLAGHPKYKGGYMQMLRCPIYSEDKKRAGMAWANPQLDFFNFYFRMKLYDDPTLNVGKMFTEFYSRFYGPAGAHVRKFIEALEDRWSDRRLRQASRMGYVSLNMPAKLYWEYMGTRVFIRHLEKLMTKAKSAAPAGSVYAQRVDLLDRAILNLISTNRQKYLKSRRSAKTAK